MPDPSAISIGALEADKGGTCERIMRTLPAWFGIEEALIGIAREAEAQPVWVAREGEHTVGCIAVRVHNEFTAEMALLAVLPDRHRRGIGRRLVATAEAWLRSRACEYFTVKTLAASRPDEHYERTRRFYAALGFRPLEEFKTFWSADNPCLFMAKRL